MKKLNLLLLLSVAFLFVAQPCFSQHPIYIMGGVQESWIQGGGSSYDSPLLGGQAGVGMGIANLTDRIGFRGELNLSLQGSHWKEGSGTESSSGHTSLTYINLPLVLRYQVESGLFGELGLQPGLLLSAKDHFPGGNQDIKSDLNTIDLGIPIGIGYELKNNLGIGLRYIMGITKINSHGTDKVHNAVLALRLTYTLNKNKK